MVKPDKIIRALAGSYSMVNNTSWRNGTEDPNPFGNDGFGIITYTPWGYMSANMAGTEPELRPTNINWPPKENDTDADWALVGKHALSYAAPFRLNESIPATETQGQLLHGPVSVSSVPRLISTTMVRNYNVYKRPDGTYLLLWAENAAGDFRAEIWWKKLE